MTDFNQLPKNEREIISVNKKKKSEPHTTDLVTDINHKKQKRIGLWRKNGVPTKDIFLTPLMREGETKVSCQAAHFPLQLTRQREG